MWIVVQRTFDYHFDVYEFRTREEAKAFYDDWAGAFTRLYIAKVDQYSNREDLT